MVLQSGILFLLLLGCGTAQNNEEASGLLATLISEFLISAICNYLDNSRNDYFITVGNTLRLIHITAFSACVCGRLLRCSAEIEKFLSLRWRSPLRNPQTAAASVNQPLVSGNQPIMPTKVGVNLQYLSSGFNKWYFQPFLCMIEILDKFAPLKIASNY